MEWLLFKIKDVSRFWLLGLPIFYLRLATPTHLLFRSTHLLFRSTHLLFRSTHLLFRSTHLLFRRSHLLFRSTHLLFRSTHLLFRRSHLLFQGTHLLFRGTHLLFRRSHLWFRRPHLWFRRCLRLATPTQLLIAFILKQLKTNNKRRGAVSASGNSSKYSSVANIAATPLTADIAQGSIPVIRLSANISKN